MVPSGSIWFKASLHGLVSHRGPDFTWSKDQKPPLSLSCRSHRTRLDSRKHRATVNHAPRAVPSAFGGPRDHGDAMRRLGLQRIQHDEQLEVAKKAWTARRAEGIGSTDGCAARDVDSIGDMKIETCRVCMGRQRHGKSWKDGVDGCAMLCLIERKASGTSFLQICF